MATTIKVERLALIAQLEQRIKEIPIAAAAYKKELEKYEKAYQDWAKKAFKSPANIERVTASHNGVHITFTDKALKSAPVEPVSPTLRYEWQINSALEELNRLVKVLKIASGDVVSASLTNKVTEYL